MATIADAILKVRGMLGDTVTSRRVAPDALDHLCDGTRVLFPASNKNLVSPIQYSADGGALTSIAPTDAAFGLVTLPAAPTSSLYLYYCYTKFTDTEVEDLVDRALSEFDFTQTNLATIPDALYTAMQHFAAAFGFQILISLNSEKYNTTVEGQSFEKSEIYKAMKVAYDTHMARAEKVRSDYWSNQSRSNKGAWANSHANYPGFKSQPRR